MAKTIVKNTTFGGKDITELEVGYLKVLSFYDRKGRYERWLCKCKCGKETIVYKHFLTSGWTKSCGCLQREKAIEAGKKNALDLTGQKFGRLTVISRNGSNRHKKSMWLCKCDCGKETIVASCSLMSKNTESCGCIQKEMMHNNRFVDLSDQIFGRLKVIKQVGKNKHGSFLWECKCDCGTIVEVNSGLLISGQTRSCGCLHKEMMHDLMFKDLKGKKIGRLMVIKQTGQNKHGSFLWECKCDCGKTKIVTSRGLIGGHTKSCGCLALEMLIKRSYNPNITDEERKLWKRNVDCRNNAWRKAILKRDKYKCVLCNTPKEKGNLVAHHIYAYATYKDKRYEVENGVTICKFCHKEFHDMYGWKDNTKEQWDEFCLLRQQREAQILIAI